MGWVTLTLRKKELKAEHAYYQLRDLQISREKRQLARKKSYEMASLQADQKAALLPLKQRWQDERKRIMSGISSLYDEVKTTGVDNTHNGENYTEGSTSAPASTVQMAGVQSNVKAVDQGKLWAYQQDLQNAQVNYQEEVNAIKEDFDNQKQMLEEEVADEETALEEEQVDIEAQMEAISQEIQAVSDAISSEIQNNTIKLS